ncbi:MAG: hypothetical protein F6K45_22530 [Kamptonema sp. SIO1D9]|nr:hypothetical protein [Kamptonema sp. SIO1D9]
MANHQPEEVEIHNQDSLREIKRMISFYQGEFVLILASCNSPILREKVVTQLRQESDYKIKELHLNKEPIATLYGTLVETFGAENEETVMVFGLELLPNLDAVLTATNQIREEFRSLHFPLILWVTDDLLAKIIRLIPDFHSWATTVEFTLSTPDLVNLLSTKATTMLTDDLDYGAENDLGINLYQPDELKFILQELDKRGEVLDAENEAKRTYVAGRIAYFHCQQEAALSNYQASLNLWQEQGKLVYQGLLSYRLALCYADPHLYWQVSKSNWQQARNYLDQCLHSFEQAERQDLVAKFITFLGETLRYLELWDELEILAQKSLVMHASEELFCLAFLLAKDYGFLAEVALKRQNWQTAKQFAQTAVREGIDRTPRHELYRLFLAQAYHNLGELNRAISILEEAKEEGKPEYDPPLYIKILGELRDRYFQRGDYLLAFLTKQEQQSLEQQYGFRAFIGAGRLQSKKSVINPSRDESDSQEKVAQELTASGRSLAIERLVSRVEIDAHKLTIIHGGSGVGKSSLLQAGLIPTLQTKIIDTRRVIPALQRLYSNLCQELQRCLLEHPLTKSLNYEPKNPADTTTILNQLRELADSNCLIVLIFDQFEEFFFVYSEPAQRREFFQFLRECLNLPFVKVILSLREDYIAYLLEGERLMSKDNSDSHLLDDILRKSNRFYLGNFTAEEAREIIHNLTAQTKFTLEPALIQQIVNDLAADSGEVLPIEMQIVGAQLQTAGITTLEKYQELGTNPKAKLVDGYLANIVQDCGEKNQETAELVLYLLTDENNTRPLKTKAELISALFDKAAQLSSVLPILVKSGLVFELQEHSEAQYQLVHDYLVPFIRQKRGAELVKELEQAKEAKRLSEEKYTRFLKKALVGTVAAGLVMIVLSVNALVSTLKATREEVKALTRSAELKLELTSEFDGLLEGLRAAKKLRTGWGSLPFTGKAEVERDVRYVLAKAFYSEFKEQNRLEGHESWVWDVKFSPDGKLLATRSVDGTAKIWTVEGQELATNGHQDSFDEVRFSPDGKLLATVSRDGTAKIWTVEGQEVTTLNGHNYSVNYVSFSPDGKLLATASNDRTAKIWTVDGQEVATLNGHNYSVNYVSFSPDGKRLATLSGYGTAKIWTVEGQELATLTGHQDSFDEVRFSPDGKLLATASRDGTAKIWTVEGQELATLNGHQDSFDEVRFSPDGKLLATASRDGTAKIWTVEGQELATLNGHQDSFDEVRFSPDGKLLATVSRDGTAKIWTVEGQEVTTLTGHKSSVNEVSFSPDGERLATASRDGTAKIWTVEGQELATLTGHQDWVLALSFSPDGERLATASKDGTAKIWSRENQAVATLTVEESLMFRVSFSPDGKLLATASFIEPASTDFTSTDFTSLNGTVNIWSRDGKLLHTLNKDKEAVWSLSFSPDGKLLATANFDGTVKIWSRDGEQVATLTGEHLLLMGMSFSPDGKLLATAGKNKTAKIWSREGKEVATITGQIGELRGVNFSPDGERLATTSFDGTTKIWSLDGQELHTLTGHKEMLMGMSFSPDGKRLATASQDGTTKIWSREGKLLHNLTTDGSRVYGVSFSPDGERLATVDSEGANIWSREGKLLHTIPGNENWIYGAIFSPDGELLSTANLFGPVYIWSPDGQLLVTLTEHEESVFGASFSPDGKLLATAGDDGNVYIWNSNFSLKSLMERGCEWMSDYLKHNPNVLESDKHLCDDVLTSER